MIFKLHWWTRLFLLTISCSYITFLDFQKSYFFSFNHTTHNKTKILVNQKHCLQHHQEWNLPKKPSFFFIISAILQGFCCFFLFICIFPCFWKWFSGVLGQKKSWSAWNNYVMCYYYLWWPWAKVPMSQGTQEEINKNSETFSKTALNGRQNFRFR